jgi:pyrimidine operon attenuation protein/uracil phosphoribosyltransferase
MDRQDIVRMISRIAYEIVEKNRGVKDLVLVGIKRRGDKIATRIAEQMKKIEEKEVPCGSLDITLYRDDLETIGEAPVVNTTDFEFDVNGKIVVLVDDVLYTGRTIRAAMDEIIDFGRPKKIQLAALIDRGHRELPIQADFVGQKIASGKKEIVNVLIKEEDGEDGVYVMGGSDEV